MRVTRNTEREFPCRVWLNDIEIHDWVVADDFRRVVETPEGPRFGSVRIQSLLTQAAEPSPADTGLSGVFEKVPEVAPEPDFTQPTVQVKPAVIEPAKVNRGKK